MRKLKLQAQMTIDGYSAGPNGELDWMLWSWDDKLKNYVTDLTDSVDTILLGRKMTDGFVSHWEKVKPDSAEYAFAQKMVNYQKVVFTKTLETSKWDNTSIVKGNIAYEVNKLKKAGGKDMIVYGGTSFVASLIKEDLIDELNLFVNPVAIGSGQSIFEGVRKDFKFAEAIPFDCGIVVLKYLPVGN